jgi:hypothetical protein
MLSSTTQVIVAGFESSSRITLWQGFLEPLYAGLQSVDFVGTDLQLLQFLNGVSGHRGNLVDKLNQITAERSNSVCRFNSNNPDPRNLLRSLRFLL